jgi:hypothetical protein
LLVTAAAAAALKVAVVAPAATVIDPGTVSNELLLANLTLVPPVGAVWLNFTVQVLTPFALNAVGVQVTGRRVGTIIEPPLADVRLRPFPSASVPIRFEI